MCYAILQTSNPNLGVALQFHNYALKTKEMRSCDNGWWRINEVMYVSYLSQECFERVCDGVVDAASLWTVSVAATWDTTQCFGSLTAAQRWSFAAAHVSLLSLSRLPTVVTTSANVSTSWHTPELF